MCTLSLSGAFAPTNQHKQTTTTAFAEKPETCPKRFHCLHSVPRVCLSLFLFYPLFFFPLLFFPLGFFRLPCSWNRWWAGLADVKRRSLTEQEEAKNLHRCNLFSKQEGKNSDPKHQNLKQVLQNEGSKQQQQHLSWKARTIFTAYSVPHVCLSLFLFYLQHPLTFFLFGFLRLRHGWNLWWARLADANPSLTEKEDSECLHREPRNAKTNSFFKRPSAVPLFISKSKALLNLNFLIGTGNTASELLKSRSMLITHIGLQPNQT